MIGWIKSGNKTRPQIYNKVFGLCIPWPGQIWRLKWAGFLQTQIQNVETNVIRHVMVGRAGNTADYTIMATDGSPWAKIQASFKNESLFSTIHIYIAGYLWPEKISLNSLHDEQDGT